MAVITISRGSYSRGKEIAEKVAAKLSYKCISRDLILEVSKDYNISEIKLVHAIHDAPKIFDRLNRNKKKYIAFIKSALLNHLKEAHPLAYLRFASVFNEWDTLEDIINVTLKLKRELDSPDKNLFEVKPAKAKENTDSTDDKSKKQQKPPAKVETKDDKKKDNEQEKSDESKSQKTPPGLF